MDKRRISNSLFLKIISTVVIGMMGLVLIISYITITSSKEAFLEIFSESQKKIFDQIDSEVYLFYRDVAEIMEQISGNKSVQKYLKGDFTDRLEERRCLLEVKDAVDATAFDEYPDCDILLAGNFGVTYVYKGSDRVTVSADEILQADVSLAAAENMHNLTVWRVESGFTNRTKDVPLIVFAKIIPDAGIVFISIPEAKFQEKYSYFTSNTSDILIFNQSGEIISSNNQIWFQEERKSELREIMVQMEENGLSHLTVKEGVDVKRYQLQRFQNVDYKILGIINPNETFEEKYNIKMIVLVTALITLALAVVLWNVLKKLTSPLHELADTMEKVGENNLEVYAEEKGTEEIRILSRTFNKMMQDINAYIRKIYAVEEEKRKAEIHALQMQIRPHYIYNTLASIKFTVWQNDMEKATKIIDAFISLLRNSISNTDKFVTVEQDIVNLQNYVFINQVRYGDHVKVEYFVAPDCTQCMIPKLILQPFVENAFFHAFPENREGYIHVFMKRDRDYLKINIKDNGIGINGDRIRALRENEEKQKEFFSGIGMNNVDSRIKLMYGWDYGINIESEEGKGTVITILFPYIEETESEA